MNGRAAAEAETANCAMIGEGSGAASLPEAAKLQIEDHLIPSTWQRLALKINADGRMNHKTGTTGWFIRG